MRNYNSRPSVSSLNASVFILNSATMFPSRTQLEREAIIHKAAAENIEAVAIVESLLGNFTS